MVEAGAMGPCENIYRKVNDSRRKMSCIFFFGLCVYMYVYMYMHDCLWTGVWWCVHVDICVYAHGGQRTNLIVALQSFPTFSLKRSLSLSKLGYARLFCQ